MSKPTAADKNLQHVPEISQLSVPDERLVRPYPYRRLPTHESKLHLRLVGGGRGMPERPRAGDPHALPGRAGCCACIKYYCYYCYLKTSMTHALQRLGGVYMGVPIEVPGLLRSQA